MCTLYSMITLKEKKKKEKECERIFGGLQQVLGT